MANAVIIISFGAPEDRSVDEFRAVCIKYGIKDEMEKYLYVLFFLFFFIIIIANIYRCAHAFDLLSLKLT